MSRPVGVSHDFLDPDGLNVWGDIALSMLDDLHIRWEYLSDDVGELRPDQVDGRPAVLFAAPSVTRSTFTGVTAPPLVLARFGVGYDNVDLASCTANDVAVTVTPDGAKRPVATATLSMMLAALHNTVMKDRLVREGRWEERTSWMGRGLTGQTVGLVGFGNTAGELVRLLEPFDVRVIAYDPHCPPPRAEAANVRLCDLRELAREADIVVVMAVLTPETTRLIDGDFLENMKPTAILVNSARGPIVDEAALVSALLADRIAGAALDVFEHEPFDANHPLTDLDTVTLSPHSIAWTNEMSSGNGASAMNSIIEFISGRIPPYVVNRDVLARPSFQQKLREVSKAG